MSPRSYNCKLVLETGIEGVCRFQSCLLLPPTSPHSLQPPDFWYPAGSESAFAALPSNGNDGHEALPQFIFIVQYLKFYTKIKFFSISLKFSDKKKTNNQQHNLNRLRNSPSGEKYPKVMIKIMCQDGYTSLCAKKMSILVLFAITKRRKQFMCPTCGWFPIQQLMMIFIFLRFYL